MTTANQFPTTTVSEGIHDSSFRSNLKDGLQRFLAHVIEHGLECGQRTPEDFIRHFPPTTIMKALEGEANLRANIMVIATGIKKKVALKKSAESSGMDLQIALDEEETDAETIVTLFDPDDRVRFLEQAALWQFVTEGAFWEVDAQKDQAAHERAAAHVAYMLQRALEDHLLTHSDMVDGIGVPKLVELLPRSELGKIISASLASGRAGKPFVERDLLTETPASVLVQHVPLSWIWSHVIVPRIAEARGLATQPSSGPAPGATASPLPAGGPAATDSPPASDADEPVVTTSGGDGLDLDLEVDAVIDELEDSTDVRDQKDFTVPSPGLKRKKGSKI